MSGETATEPMDFNWALAVIAGMTADLETLVTYALRNHGCGGDGGGVTYPADQDDFDKNQYQIPPGHVEMYIVSPGHHQEFLGHEIFGTESRLVTEPQYIHWLIEACRLEGLDERANLLERFLDQPEIAHGLVEASGLRCQDMWRKFRPFLEAVGWSVKENGDEFTICSPNDDYWFVITADAQDLGVLYRVTKRQGRGVWKTFRSRPDYQKSLLKALERFFEHEKEAHL